MGLPWQHRWFTMTTGTIIMVSRGISIKFTCHGTAGLQLFIGFIISNHPRVFLRSYHWFEIDKRNRCDYYIRNINFGGHNRLEGQPLSMKKVFRRSKGEDMRWGTGKGGGGWEGETERKDRLTWGISVVPNRIEMCTKLPLKWGHLFNQYTVYSPS